MAQDILNLFSGLFSGVISWFTNNLGNLFSNLIGMFLEALIDGAKKTLSDIVHALLGGLVSEVVEGIEAVNWIPEWVKYGLTTFAGNVGSALGTIADGAITMVAEGSAAILEVTSAQEQYMTELQTSLAVTSTALLDRIEAGQAQDIAIGEETAVIMIESLNRNVNIAYSEAIEFLEGTTLALSGQMQGARTFALEMLGSTLLNVQHTGRVALEMIDQGIAGVSTYLSEHGIGEAERFFQTIQNTIVIPAATAEAFQWALSNIEPFTREELKDAVIDYLIVQHEVSLQMHEQNIIVPPIPPE